MEEIFKRVREAGLEVHPQNCVFGAHSIDFLGHLIFADSLQAQEEKLAAIPDLPAPTDLHSLRAALRLFSYYRNFVLHFSSIAHPLNQLLKKDAVWQWGDKQMEAFQELKLQLCQSPVLQLPNAYKPFILTTD